MKVSVAMITYNHEQFIAQAIESALMQQVNFDYEIVIGEDCSTDITRSIVISYQQKYPHKIRLLLPETNLGINRNFMATLQSCQREYIALLEGDDYWISPYKLQKQVDFLDAHPECSICFHNSKHFYQDNSYEPYYSNQPDQKEISTIDDLLTYNFIPTASTMFRRGLFGPFPDWFLDLYGGDWPLHILNAQYGSIGYINEVMVATRIHKGGAWNGISKIKQLEGVIKNYLIMRENLAVMRNKVTQTQISKCYFELAEEYMNLGDFDLAKAYSAKSVVESPINPLISKKKLLKLYMQLYINSLYQPIMATYKKLKVNK